MTITFGGVDARGDKALKLAVTAAEGKIRKLSEQVAEQSKTINTFVAAKAAAESAAADAAIRAWAVELQKSGHIPAGEQALTDAVELRKLNPELAERVYSMQIPPQGTEAGTDPQAESGRDTSKPLLMSQLTDTQQAEYEALRGYGKNEKEALEFIARRAAATAN